MQFSPWEPETVAERISSKVSCQQTAEETTYVCVCAHTQSCLTLCDPWIACSPPHSSVHGISQAGILNGLAFPPPGDHPDPGIEPASLASPVLAGGFFTTVPPGKSIN